MKTHNVTLPFEPFAHQREAHALRLKNRFTTLVWARRSGKTVFSGMELLLAALRTDRQDAMFGYICPFLKQSKTVAWLYIKRFAAPIPGVEINESELSVKLPNGAKVRLFGADNGDALRGMYFDGIVIDEVADMKPDVWGEIIRPALADRQGWALFIGTPKGINLFSELYYRGLGGEPGWASDLRRASEVGVIPADEIEAARREMSPSQFAAEFDCDFAAAVDDVLVRLDDVLAAQKRVIIEADYMYGAKILGVDVARYGGDRTVIIKRQGLVAFPPLVSQGSDLMATASRVAQLIEEWAPDATFIDAGGVGAGVIDRLLQLGHTVMPVDFGGKANSERFENKRAEMWWEMAGWLKTAHVPDLKELTQDLTAPRYTYKNARGRLQLESKDDMRKRGLPSPDVGDALAVTFSSTVVPAAMRTQWSSGRVGHEYDPYQEVQ